jgi:hypothetical protein
MKFIDDDARARGEAEGCLVVECDAERRTRAGRERVVLKNAVADLQGSSGRGIAASHCRAALQGRHLTDFTN